MTKLQLAKTRQRVRALKARRNVLEHVAMAHHPMVAGSFIERRFKTGQTAYFLSIPTPQNSWHRYVRKSEVDHFRRRAAAWSEYVNAMAEWVRTNPNSSVCQFPPRGTVGLFGPTFLSPLFPR